MVKLVMSDERSCRWTVCSPSLIPVTLLLVLLCYPAFGKENKYCKPLKQIKGDVKVNVLYSRENHLKRG